MFSFSFTYPVLIGLSSLHLIYLGPFIIKPHKQKIYRFPCWGHAKVNCLLKVRFRNSSLYE